MRNQVQLKETMRNHEKSEK